MGLSQNLSGKIIYVYRPARNNIKVEPPKNVPDAKITGEVWSKSSVTLVLSKKIKVIDSDDLDGIKFTHGNDEEAVLYPWRFGVLEDYEK